MPDYALYGGCLRSEIELPELAVARMATPDWMLSVGSPVTPAWIAEPPEGSAELLGEEDLGSGIIVRHFKNAGGYRIAYQTVGAFDLSPDGRRIELRALPDVDPALVSLAVAGRVLATALHCAGALCLHGSAVAFGDGAVAFVAPKFHGKSTLALALTAAGARLVTDDMLPVELGPPAFVRPGVQNVRLFQDSLDTIQLRDINVALGPGGKHVLTDLDERSLMLDRARLCAIHVLHPVVARPGGAPVERARLQPIPAALSLVQHAKLGAVLGKSEAAVVLDRAVRLARQIPVYALRVARDYDRLGEVVAHLQQWYDARPSADRPS